MGDAEERWESILSMSITLMAENEPDSSKRVLFQKNYHVRESLMKRKTHSHLQKQ